jgi:serine/threonine protein phosphatase PrpC
MFRCPSCSDPVGPHDQYCEACGQALHARGVGSRTIDRRETDLGQVAAVSDRGLVHTVNEDAYFIALDEEGLVAVVCDGVSSSTAGGVAARVAADAAGRALLESRPTPDAVSALVDAVDAAQRAVRALSWAPMRGSTAPSTTIVAAVSTVDGIAIAWLGDSRAYWITERGGDALTRDDSWAELQVAEGTLSAEEARLDPRAHMITAWLGADAGSVSPTVTALSRPDDGRLLLCSDGLWNPWPAPDDLAALTRASGGDRSIDVARGLTDRAIDVGGRDNITVVVADLALTASVSRRTT